MSGNPATDLPTQGSSSRITPASSATNPYSALGQRPRVKLRTEVRLHKPTASVQASKKRVENAIESLQFASPEEGFDEANNVLRVALNRHAKIAHCAARCDAVAEHFDTSAAS